MGGCRTMLSTQQQYPRISVLPYYSCVWIVSTRLSMTVQQHPQQCMTCSRRENVTCPLQDEKNYYKVKEYVSVPKGWETLTSIIGCASYSPQTLTKSDIDHILAAMHYGCPCLHTQYVHKEDYENCKVLIEKLRSLKREVLS
jgi:hypothetical protein